MATLDEFNPRMGLVHSQVGRRRRSEGMGDALRQQEPIVYDGLGAVTLCGLASRYVCRQPVAELVSYSRVELVYFE